MSPLDIWIMIQSTERELALRPRRLAQRRYLDEAIAQSMPEHARQGLPGMPSRAAPGPPGHGWTRSAEATNETMPKRRHRPQQRPASASSADEWSR
jgi:hypothetical protein